MKRRVMSMGLCLGLILVAALAGWGAHAVVPPRRLLSGPTWRAPGPHSVWIIGDSITRGLYASSEETTFRSRIFRALRARYPARIYSTFWQGVCTLGRLEERWGTWPGRPDVLFLELGTNDVSRNPNCPQVPEADWARRYGAMLDRIRRDAPGVLIVVGTIPWPGWSPESDRYRRAVRYNRWITAAAQERKIPVADLWAVTVGREDGLSTPADSSPYPPRYRGDGFHPNDIGHARIAEAFLQAFEQGLRSQQP